jgi:protein ImuA
MDRTEKVHAMWETGPSGASVPGETRLVSLTRLREEVAALARGPGNKPDVAPLPFGLPELDRILGGGLLRGALHEVTPAAEGDATKAAGFSAALIAHALSGGKKPALWVRHEFVTLEDGAPYGPGLAAFGLDPGRVLFVLAVNAREVCGTMEHALRSGMLAAVLGEVRGSSKLDLRVTRRLSLAAEHGATPGVLLRLGAREKQRARPISAATRWRIAALASGAAPANGLSPPRFSAELVRNRRGPAANFSLEWRTHDRTFHSVPSLREHLAPAALDRPDPASAPAGLRAPA